jgi:LytS/YehU family sensor histidine kinase
MFQSKTIKWIALIITGVAICVFALYDYELEASLLTFAFVTILIIYGIRLLIKEIRLINELKNERAKAELLHLKSQVNPHFFFNILNNLYGLVDKDAKKAQALILRLSDMMRYGIYEGEKESVTLKDEIDYLKNYIELHKMRYHKNVDVRFVLEVKDDTVLVMPLLFIILLENAFKHGVENLTEGAYVYLKLDSDINEVRFKVSNSFDEDAPKTISGIGLKNLKRRLELSYSEKHSLTFDVTKNVYTAQLTLQLK